MRNLFISLLLLTLTVGLATAQDTAAPVISPELDTELDAIEEAVITVRGLEPLQEVNRRFPSRPEVSEFLETSITEQLTPEIEAEAVAFYRAFDFIEDDIDLIDVYLTLLEDQVGGYYDPIDQTMNTILISGGELGDDLPLLEETVYAHEFVHALQDQYFDLEALGFTPETIDEVEGDQFLAVQALVEGDATVVMNIYLEAILEENPLAAFALLGSSLTSGSLTLPEGTPDILMRELLYPYTAGAEFVTFLVNNAGWEAVDAAFADLPVSTEQVLHPEKYLSGEQPLTVTLNDTASVLGDGWTEIDEATLGEFYLRAYLDNQLLRDDWQRGASGWGGDRYRIHVDESGDVAMVLRLAWDTVPDAEEFSDVYTLYADTRYEAQANSEWCWSSASEARCLRTLTSGETVVTRAPTLELAQALLESQTPE